jgi:outer membrane protein assembly factor BamE (lipoprotein component of BamABCDE complex)
MKLFTSFMMVVACMFSLVGCAEQPRRNIHVIEVVPPPEPEIKTLVLVVGKTTRDDVAAVIGQPKTVSTIEAYKHTHWIYSFENLPEQNVIINISATGKDGFTYTYRFDLRRKCPGLISLSFTGNYLKDFSIM